MKYIPGFSKSGNRWTSRENWSFLGQLLKSCQEEFDPIFSRTLAELTGMIKPLKGLSNQG